jgi:hypothetical protein
LLDFLVNSFRFSIGLRVKGCREFLLDPEFSPKLLGDLCSKLRSAIRDDREGETRAFPNVIDEQLTSLLGCDGFVTGGQDDRFAMPVDDG